MSWLLYTAGCAAIAVLVVAVLAIALLWDAADQRTLERDDAIAERDQAWTERDHAVAEARRLAARLDQAETDTADTRAAGGTPFADEVERFVNGGGR